MLVGECFVSGIFQGTDARCLERLDRNAFAQGGDLATLTEDLARFALRVRWEDVPDDVVALAKEHLLDTLGIVLAVVAL